MRLLHKHCLSRPAHGSTSAPNARSSPRGGFGLVEVMISMTVLTVALLAFSQAILSALAASQAQQEQGVARDAARQMIERMQAEGFAEVFARYNATVADDPALGNLFTASFAVQGLQAQRADADGMVGEILFPTSGGAGGALLLREDLDDDQFGTPRDLNADGVVDALDHSGDYMLLPVVVRLSWRGRVGNSSLEFRTFLADL